MKIEIYTGIAPEFKPLAIVAYYCPHCSRLIKTPAQQLVERIASSLEDYFKERNLYLERENRRLRDIIEYGNQIHLIQEVSKRISQ